MTREGDGGMSASDLAAFAKRAAAAIDARHREEDETVTLTFADGITWTVCRDRWNRIKRRRRYRPYRQP